MDNSETYIKMNDKLPEDFPDKYVLRWGDYYALNGEVRIYLQGALAITKNMRDAHAITKGITKLHRQDQLQEMVGINPLDLDRFRNFIGDMENNHRDSWNTGVWLSWERLWLAFCMSEKFNKIWDGESWVVKK